MLISLIVALLATIAAAGTMPVHNVPRKKNNPPDNSTQPWQILNLYACYPYDLPGNYHDAVINVTIRDTNSIHAKTKKDLVYRFPPSLGTCSIRWKVRRANAPWGIEHSCVSNSIYSEWSLEMLKPWGASSNSRSATENFMLRFMVSVHRMASKTEATELMEVNSLEITARQPGKMS